MKKKITVFTVFVLLICSVLCCNAFAESASSGSALLIDRADLLTSGEESNLVSRLADISNKCDVEIAIVTIDGLGGKSAEYMAEYLYDELEYGSGSSRSGVMLLISLDGSERDWAVHIHGAAEAAIGDREMQSIMNEVLPYLSADDFYSAFNAFADECGYYIGGYGEVSGSSFEFGRNLIIALVIGFVVAFIATSVMKGKLKSVRFRNQAADYVRNGSMNVTVSRDFFLYRNITRTARPKNNPGGPGRSSGGGRTYSGKF